MPEVFKDFPQHSLDAARNSIKLAKHSPDLEPFPLLRLVVGSQRLRLKRISSGALTQRNGVGEPTDKRQVLGLWPNHQANERERDLKIEIGRCI